ncbi:UTP--glucose-1-phosphate uridylyltransferase GalU [Gammaproteobacteria bacterium]|nr:UTP--glucose-1-phosphate uridylyltransferase GalU [Gammaproteobacteria bacterium]
MSKIRKALLPVAGHGTRFLPASKATPKEMLPIIDKPLVQYAVEEAIEIGIEEIIFIISPQKYSIKKHFDFSEIIEKKLIESNKEDLLEKANPENFKDLKFTYINQDEQKGLGHAILLAKDYILDEPFAILLPDDLFFSKKSCLAQLSEIYHETSNSVIAVNRIDSKNIHKYGVIDPGSINDRFIEIKGIVEKPKPEEAPSDIAVCGRYILNSSIFNYLEETSPDKANEIQLTDAIKLMLKDEKISACIYKGEKFDCGSKQGYVEATISISLRDNEIKDDIKNYIKQLKI